MSIGLSRGDSPVPYAEIRAWLSEAGMDASLWEFESWQRLSSAFVGASHRFRDKDAVNPHMSEPDRIEHARRMEHKADQALRTSSRGTSAAKTKGRPR